MDAAIAEMAVKRRLVAVFFEQPIELAQIGADMVGRHRCILPAFPDVGVAGDKGGGAEPGLAHLPDPRLRPPVADELCVRRRDPDPQVGDQPLRFLDRVLLAVAAKFGNEPAVALRQCAEGRLVHML